MTSRKWFALFILLLMGCSSDKQQNINKKGIYPLEEFPVVPDLALPHSGEKIGHEANSDGSVSYTSLRTIMAQNGRVLTIWALAEGNWLWAYGVPSSSSFGGSRNWHIIPMDKTGVSVFKLSNEKTETCMEAYKNGVIHNACDVNNTSQDFILIPATNGGVFLKSFSLNRCLRYDMVTHTIYSGVYLTNCSAENEKNYDQIWYIAPALTNTIPLP